MKKPRPDPLPDAPPGWALPTPAGVVRARWAAVGLTLALVGLGLAWELWWAPLRPGGSLWAIKVLPLSLFLPGLLKNRMYTYRALSLLLWLYVLEGGVRIGSTQATEAWLSGAQILLCVGLFSACTLHIRLRLRAARAWAQQTPSSTSGTPT